MIKFKIVTPERVLLEKEVESLTAPTKDGEITVLKNHIPLVSSLLPGELKYRDGAGESFFAVSGGFLEVRPDNQVIILADTAEAAAEIDLDRAEQARVRAQKMMREGYRGEKAAADAVAALERNLARLKVARRHRTHTSRNLESGTLHE